MMFPSSLPECSFFSSLTCCFVRKLCLRCIVQLLGIPLQVVLIIFSYLILLNVLYYSISYFSWNIKSLISNSFSTYYRTHNGCSKHWYNTILAQNLNKISNEANNHKYTDYFRCFSTIVFWMSMCYSPADDC